MRKVIFALFFALILVTPARAMEFNAPEPPASVKGYMPENPAELSISFLKMLGKALTAVRPDLKEAGRVCTGLIATVLLISVLQGVSEQIRKSANLAGTASIGATFLLSFNAMIPMARQTITDLCEYGKLLLPVMSSAMAAQGSTASSAALYAGTLMVIGCISAAVSRVLVPSVYLFLALAIAGRAVGESVLKRIGDQIKGIVSWSLKTLLTLFLGYMSITGAISGTADATAAKVLKAAISTAVPVVGGILSNATESVLVGAGIMKNAAGIYGIFALLAIVLEPFLRIGAHYLMLKATCCVCSVFGCKEMTELIGDFSSALGLLLAMTGTVCVLLLFSTVCFLKGVG